MSGPNKSSLISFPLISSTMEARFSFARRVSCSADFVALEGISVTSRCLEFLCLVKPPFDLHIFVQWGQGNDYLPSISAIASANTALILSLSVSTQQQRKHRDYCMIHSQLCDLAIPRLRYHFWLGKLHILLFRHFVSLLKFCFTLHNVFMTFEQ